MKTRMGVPKESNYDLAIPSATSTTGLDDLPGAWQDGNSYLNTFESYMDHFDNYLARQQMYKGYSSGVAALPPIGDIPRANYSLPTTQSQGLPSSQNGSYSGDLIAFKPSVSSTGSPVEDSGWFSNLYNVSATVGAGASAAASTTAASPTSGISGINNGIFDNANYGSTSHNVANPGLNFDNVVNGALDGTSVKLSDFVRLTEAIQDLICRLPRPPTEELLRNLEPKLAFTLHMTYLKAYIYNQQLLQDIKNSFIGMFAGGVGVGVGGVGGTDASKGTMRNYFAPNAIANVSNNSSVPMVGYDYGLYDGTVGGASVATSGNNFGLVGNNTASITDNGGAMPIEDSSGYMPNLGGYYQQYPPPLASHAHQQAPLPLGMEPRSQQINRVAPDDVCGHSLANPRSDTMLNDRSHPATAIPPDLKATVKYDARKHAYVAVMVGPLGGRRRRAFSIRKFGKERALKLAAKYAISSGAKVAIKERGLFEHVCEYALSLNPNSGKKLDYINEAQSLPETRGVVFSCGAQAWLTITYDSDSRRFIKGFTVDEHGFNGAHEKALQHLNEAIQKHGLVASKLSGILCFWLERDANGDRVLCVLLQGAEMRRSTGQENYIGRFPLANSSFNATKLAAQKWRAELKKQAYHQQNDLSDGTFENEDDCDGLQVEDDDADEDYIVARRGANRRH